MEAEIKPFKGVLLGLFFLCTGASVDVHVLIARFPTIALLTVGLISVKFAITSIAARLFGLSEGESVKVGLTLSQVRAAPPAELPAHSHPADHGSAHGALRSQTDAAVFPRPMQRA